MSSTNSAVTPNRATRAIFDFPEQVVIEDAWDDVRGPGQVARFPALTNGVDTYQATNMRQWKSGAWTLRPLQDVLSESQERIPAPALGQQEWAYGPDNEPSFTPIPDLVVNSIGLIGIPGWAKNNSPGIGYASSVLSTGDTMFMKRQVAGETWAQFLNKSWDFGVDLEPNAPLDRVMDSRRSARPDQGFFLRWNVPGTVNNAPDYILAFYFGQYVVVIRGDGRLQLWEYCRGSSAGAYRPALRKTFRYARPSSVCNTTHTLTIFPLLGPQGQKYIHFIAPEVENLVPGLMTVGGFGANSGPTSSMEELYEAGPLTRGNDVDESPGHVTKAAQIALDIRRDLRVLFQVSQLRFVASGQLVDQPMALPTHVSAQPLKMSLAAAIPANIAGTPATTPSITATLRNATTRAAIEAFTFQRGGASMLRQTSAPVSSSNTHLYTIFNFVGDTRDTPVLWGYGLHRDPVVETVAPGQFEAKVTSVNVTGASGPEPQAESGVVTISDLTGTLTRLRTRAELPAKIVTTFLPPGGGSAVDVTLLRGYARRVAGKRRGGRDAEGMRGAIVRGPRTGALGQGGYRQFPSPEWRDFTAILAGTGHRLGPLEKSTRIARSYRNYAEDHSAPRDPLTGALQPWKATAAIRDCFRVAGFPDSMIDIADSPIRLWPGLVGTQNSDLEIDPNTDPMSRAVMLARNYLGANVIFDPNAGAAGGQWKLIYGAGAPGQTPLFHFQTYQQYDDRLPHVPGAYPDNTTFVAEEGERYAIAPECNHVWVFTAPPMEGLSGGVRFEAHAYNPKSYRCPPYFTTAPDPNGPHWIGRERLYVLPEPSLQCATPEDTQWAVDFTCRRVFEVAGLARYVQPFSAPLSIIQDPVGGHWRPLRFGDPVTYNGEADWFIYSADEEYERDPLQIAHYEIHKRIPLL